MRNDDETKMNSRVTNRNYGRNFEKNRLIRRITS